LLVQCRFQFIGKRELAPPVVLGHAGLEPQYSRREVHLPPLHRQKFGRCAPPSDICHRQEWAVFGGQCRAHALEVGALEESLPGVVLFRAFRSPAAP
jgi:hypothetical protein